MDKASSNVNIPNDIPEKKDKQEVPASECTQNEILEKYDIFSNVYTSSDNLSFVDSEEDTSSKNLDDLKNKNILSLTVHNIINIYPNNERNREFKKYKQKKIEEKRKKEYDEEREIIEQKKKIYEEKRQKKLHIYNVAKKKKKLIEKEKYNKENIEYNYLMISNHFKHLMENGKHSDIYFSFHDMYISPMRLYYFASASVDQIYYLDLSRKWLPDNYVSIILELCSRKRVKILNLSFNKITFKGLGHISKFLLENKVLFCLNLENNDLTNKGQNADELNKFFESIKNNKGIKILNLANTNMNKVALLRLPKRMMKFSAQRCVILYEYMLAQFLLTFQSNGESLCKMLEANNSIIEMNFENSNFTRDQNCQIINCLIRNKNIWLKQAEMEKEENDKMEKEESYMNAYLMSVESSIIEIENRENRRNLNKMIYVNMWREEIKQKELKEEAILETLEKEHENRMKNARKKKRKKKKK